MKHKNLDWIAYNSYTRPPHIPDKTHVIVVWQKIKIIHTLLTWISTETGFKNKTSSLQGFSLFIAHPLHLNYIPISPSLYFLYTVLSTCILLEQHLWVRQPQSVQGIDCCHRRTLHWPKKNYFSPYPFKLLTNLGPEYALNTVVYSDF